MDDAERIKLGDLGLAVEFKSGLSLTRGTWVYMSPEAINQEPVDYKTDVW